MRKTIVRAFSFLCHTDDSGYDEEILTLIIYNDDEQLDKSYLHWLVTRLNDGIMYIVFYC